MFGSSAKKSLGQNFLVSPSVARKIVRAVSPLPGELVFEIGPGRGALTEPLAECGADVVAFEIDAALVSRLEGGIGARGNVEIVHADVQDIDFDSAALQRKRERYAVAGNIPYNLTSSIMLALPGWKGCGRAVFMVQKEVGDRILASPGERNCGILTVFLQSYFSISRVMRVRPGSFLPRPKVDSIVLKLEPKNGDAGPADRDGFLAFIKHCFSQRRKKLRNNLRDMGCMVDAGDPDEIGRRSDVDLEQRPEELDLDSWFRLFGACGKLKGSR